MDLAGFSQGNMELDVLQGQLSDDFSLIVCHPNLETGLGLQ
jgi:hypothetical protein